MPPVLGGVLVELVDKIIYFLLSCTETLQIRIDRFDSFLVLLAPLRLANVVQNAVSGLNAGPDFLFDKISLFEKAQGTVAPPIFQVLADTLNDSFEHRAVSS